MLPLPSLPSPAQLYTKISVTGFALIILPFAMMLGWIRNLKTIAPTSIVATTCLAYSFVVIFGQFNCMLATSWALLHGHVDIEYCIGHLGKTVQMDPTCEATTSALNVTTVCATNTGVVAFAGDGLAIESTVQAVVSMSLALTTHSLHSHCML